MARYGRRGLVGYQYYLLKEYADQTDRPQAYYVKEAIDQYLKNNIKQISAVIKQQNLQEKIDALPQNEQDEIPPEIRRILIKHGKKRKRKR